MIPITYFKNSLSFLLLAFTFMIFQPLIAQKTVWDANTGRSNKSNSELFKPQGTGFGIGLNAGSARPLGEYGGEEQFAGSGLSFKGNLEYNWKSWGLGITAGSFSNAVNNKVEQRLDELLLTYTSFYTKNTWNINYYGIGPNINIPSIKWPINIYMRGGFMHYNTPQFSTFTEETITPIDLINYPTEEQFSTAFVSAGAKFHYQFNRSIAISLDVGYLRGLNPREYLYTFKDFEMFGDPPYNENQIQRAPIVERVIEVNPEVLHIGLGLRYTFGSRKPKKPKRAVEREQPKEELSVRCLPVQLKSPQNQSDYYLNLEDRPIYSWVEHKATTARLESHMFKLLDPKGNVIYQKRTKDNQIKHSSELEKIYEAQLRGKSEEERKTLNWQVVSQYQNCEQQVGKARSISISRRSTGLTIDFKNIQCQSPAYDSDGDVLYTGDILLINTGSSNITVLDPATNFTLENQNGSNVSPIDQVTDPSGWSGDVVLGPGDSKDFTIDFTRPVGQTSTVIRIPYTVSGITGVNNEPQLVDLPSCVCNVCEEWIIQANSSQLSLFNNPYSNVELSSMINIQNSDPIMEVTAEIAYLEYEAGEEKCYECVTHASEMGLANKGEVISLTPPGSQNPWENQGIGTLLEDENADGYANQVRWRADDPDVGLNLASTFTIYMNLPEISFKDCCDQRYRVCVRYIFTDVNCRTCDKLICYGYNTASDGGNGSGKESSNGTNESQQ